MSNNDLDKKITIQKRKIGIEKAKSRQGTQPCKGGYE
jgi:hypothetical protein